MHFKAIADIIAKNTYTQANDGYKYVSLEVLIDELVSYFLQENSRFDAFRFERACHGLPLERAGFHRLEKKDEEAI